MKPTVIAVLLSAILAFYTRAEPPDPVKKEFVDLAENLAPADSLLRWNALVEHPETAESKEAVEAARQRLAAAKASIPKIRKLIKPGTSVFDYPGLLALGRITTSGIYFSSKASPKYNYDLYLGAHFGGGEGIHAYDFTVTFNEQGIIAAVKNVDWKK